MKVEVKDKEDLRLVDYEPTILKNKETGDLVLFTSFSEVRDGKITEMVALKSSNGCSKLCNWNVDKFELFKGVVTLSND